LLQEPAPHKKLLPIRHVMEIPHYVPKPALPKMPG
jgi:hypothetical protein